MDQVEMHSGKSSAIVRFRNLLRCVVIKCEHQASITRSGSLSLVMCKAPCLD